MKLRIHLSHKLSLSLSLLWLALPRGLAQSADDFFHNGAVNYLSNNIPKALEVVTNGRAIFPDDIKLKKLEELLKQQNQQQQQQQQQPEQKDQQQQQDKQDQQQKQDSKSDQQKQQEQKQQQKDEQKKQEQQDKRSEEQQREAQAQAAGQMTPQEAKQLMDSVKNDDKMLIFKPDQKERSRQRPIKDW